MADPFRRTRIVATLGPASSSPEMIGTLIDAGVDVFRLNFSHGERELHQRNVTHIRESSSRVARPIGILQDLQGPKIRIGTFAADGIDLVSGNTFELSCDDDTPGDVTRVGVSYRRLCADVRIDDLLLLDDGRLSLRVTGIAGATITTNVVRGGRLSDHKGINIPGASLSIPAMTEKDESDLAYGAELGVDWVAVSFVRSRDDVLLARHYLGRAASTARLMAKIEKPTAVEKFAEILPEVDGVMVARGDLGVEMSSEQVPLIQKRLIRSAREAGKPVVTATQMLETMTQNPYPTRAEASDVANAIHDGTDAVMLSGETAVGKYPEESVRMMARIARSMEADTEYQRTLSEQHPPPQETVADSVSLAACDMAKILNAKVIVTFSMSGATALRVARNRYATPIVAITPLAHVFRQLSMAWGILPFLSEQIHTSDEMVEVAGNCIRQSGLVDPGDRYLITAGVPFGVQGTTNLIRVEVLR